MKSPSPKTLQLIQIAVQMRIVAHASWEMIGQRVKRHPRTCWNWQYKYAAYWLRFSCELFEHLLTVAAPEALAVQRDLRDNAPDERIRRSAARFLEKHGLA